MASLHPLPFTLLHSSTPLEMATPPLRQGTYGTLYLARPRTPTSSSQLYYAVKHLPDGHLTTAQKELQRQEATIHGYVSMLRHPNIVDLIAVIDPRMERLYAGEKQVDETQGSNVNGWWMMMEYCNGGDLFDFITQGGLERLSGGTREGASAVAAELFSQTCHGIQACHDLGIAHRDIKGENILLSWTRCEDAWNVQVKIADFGLACFVPGIPLPENVRCGCSKEMSTAFSRGCGSDFYMPEEIRLSSTPPPEHYDPRAADVWSLGILLSNLATRRNPWYKASRHDVGYAAYKLKPSAKTLQFLVPLLHRDVSAVLASVLKIRWEERLEMKPVDIAKRVRALPLGWCVIVSHSTSSTRASPKRNIIEDQDFKWELVPAMPIEPRSAPSALNHAPREPTSPEEISMDETLDISGTFTSESTHGDIHLESESEAVKSTHVVSDYFDDVLRHMDLGGVSAETGSVSLPTPQSPDESIRLDDEVCDTETMVRIPRWQPPMPTPKPLHDPPRMASSPHPPPTPLSVQIAPLQTNTPLNHSARHDPPVSLSKRYHNPQHRIPDTSPPSYATVMKASTTLEEEEDERVCRRQRRKIDVDAEVPVPSASRRKRWMDKLVQISWKPQ